MGAYNSVIGQEVKDITSPCLEATSYMILLLAFHLFILNIL